MIWQGHYGAGRVVLRAAPKEPGLLLRPRCGAVFEAIGVQDVVAKSVGTSNPHNMVKAAFAALTGIVSPRSVAARRGRRVSEILGKRVGDNAPSASASEA